MRYFNICVFSFFEEVFMTYKELADKLGVKKDRVRYVAEHLNLPNATYRVDGVIHMTPAAVNMITAEIDGIPRENSAIFPYVHSEIPQCETAETPQNGAKYREISAESDAERQDGAKSDRENSAVTLTFIDHYKTVISSQTAQLAAKDEQFKKLVDYTTAVQANINEQLKAKDAQLSRMQDTVDALTKQLADAAERERQLQATIEQRLEQRLEQSREQPRKWWQWWKR